MENQTTLPSIPITPVQLAQNAGTREQRPADYDKSRYCLQGTIYAVGTDPAGSIKERIAETHGADSDVARAADELEAYIADPEFKQNCWYRRFFYKLRSKMGKLNCNANEYEKSYMASEFVEELVNGGYIRCLKSLAVPSGQSHVAFVQSYGETHNMPIGAALLFCPTGGARTELSYFMTAEKSHGQHRPVTSNIWMSDEARERWFATGRTVNWPTVINEAGSDELLDVAKEQGRLPEGAIDSLRELWRRNPSLRDYSGANRLSGEIPFQIVEDAADIVFHSKSTPPAIRAKYDQIVETANREGIDSFCAVYKQLFSRKDQLRPYWEKARKVLYEYSLMLWEERNEQWLTEGKRNAADGVTYRPCRVSIKKPLKTVLPGTIYLNNGRYFWVVKDKMNPVGLVDDRNKRVLPGTIGNDKGRYFWVVPEVLKRQRLVTKSEKFSTTDRQAAEEIALRLWERIQSKRPRLAAKIKARRPWGTATKDKAIAIKIARRMWKNIQHNNPELTAKILTDNRPVAKDHWIAQICAGGIHRHIGSFKTREEAMAVYTKEFEKVFGYPPGYNVQSMPKLDKVWPIWEEEKARLEVMNIRPSMPVIGLTDQTKSLLPVIRRMQEVDWIAMNCMVVLDDSTPYAAPDIAIESRGKTWYGEIKQQGKNTVIYGCTAIDKDSGRIRITLFSPAFENTVILAEEVYHLVYRIIGNTHPVIAKKIQQWYQKKVGTGLDATMSEDEAFAQAMAHEYIVSTKSDLPRCVVKDAQKLFSKASRIPNSVIETIITAS